MNLGDKPRTGGLDAGGRAAGVLDQWAEALAQVLDSMTDQRPQVTWQAVAGTAAAVSSPEYTYLWWEHPFSAAPGAVAWIGAPQPTWEHVGTLTLKAAGLETVATSEAQNTWFEIIGQSLSAMARSIGGLVGHEVTCGTGAEREGAPESAEWASVSIAFADGAQPPLLVALSPIVLSLIAVQPPPAPAPGRPARTTASRVSRVPSMPMVVERRMLMFVASGSRRLPGHGTTMTWRPPAGHQHSALHNQSQSGGGRAPDGSGPAPGRIPGEPQGRRWSGTRSTRPAASSRSSARRSGRGMPRVIALGSR